MLIADACQASVGEVGYTLPDKPNSRLQKWNLCDPLQSQPWTLIGNWTAC
jgi:hypothetical protein